MAKTDLLGIPGQTHRQPVGENKRQTGGESPAQCEAAAHQEVVVSMRGWEAEAARRDAMQQLAGVNEGRGRRWTREGAAG